MSNGNKKKHAKNTNDKKGPPHKKGTPIKCNYCGKLGHTEEKCRKKIYDEKKKPRSEDNRMITEDTDSNVKPSTNSTAIDVGAMNDLDFDKLLADLSTEGLMPKVCMQNAFANVQGLFFLNVFGSRDIDVNGFALVHSRLSP